MGVCVGDLGRFEGGVGDLLEIGVGGGVVVGVCDCCECVFGKEFGKIGRLCIGVECLFEVGVICVRVCVGGGIVVVCGIY